MGVSAHVGEFSSLTRRSGLIEVYAKSSVPAEWRAGTSGDWIRLSSRSGRTAGGDSVTVDIDWARVPEGRTLSGYVCISGEESKEYVIVKAVNPSDEIAPGTFVEDDGVMIDSLAPRMEPEMNMVEFGENHKIPILHECFINKGTLCIDAPGMHTLKLICGTEGVMFQKIVLDFGGLTRSWNGPETTIKN